MADSSSQDPSAPKKEAAASPATSTDVQTWKLPDGIEDHLESGLIKTALGVAAGGVVGMIMFRSGGGWRSASVAAGVGVAVGSTYERIVASTQETQSS